MGGGCLRFRQISDRAARDSADGAGTVVNVDLVPGLTTLRLGQGVHLCLDVFLAVRTGRSSAWPLPSDTGRSRPRPEKGDPGVEQTGTVSSSWLGPRADGLPPVAACPDTMPRPSRLALTATALSSPHQRLTITGRVTADIHGEERPVQGATVRVDA